MSWFWKNPAFASCEMGYDCVKCLLFPDKAGTPPKTRGSYTNACVLLRIEITILRLHRVIQNISLV